MTQILPSESKPIPMPTNRTLFDPPAELGQIREQQPVSRLRYPDGHVGWLVTSHALARSVLGDTRFSMHPMRLPVPVGEPDKQQNAGMIAALRNEPRFSHVFRRYEREGRAPYDALDDPELLQELRSSPPSYFFLIGTDPPMHTRLRRMLAGYFTVRRVSEYRDEIERIVAERLDAMEEAGAQVDLVETFTQPVVSLATCALLGASPSDRDKFERPAVIKTDPTLGADEKLAALQEIHDFTRRLIQDKRAHPADDLLSDLARRGELTDDDELADVAVQLFDAGHDTTANMLALSTLALLHDRDRWEALRADPTLIGNAIEELLRFVTLIQVGAFTRTALQDVDLDGTLIKTGESVTVSLAAANRDPDRFPEPDNLDLGRNAAGHLAFGHGIHQCLGQHLARLEMQIALKGLMRRFPTLRLAVPVDDIPLHPSDHFLYGMWRLPVTW